MLLQANLKTGLMRALAFIANAFGLVAIAGFGALMFSPYGAFVYHGEPCFKCDWIEFVSNSSLSDAVIMACVALIWEFFYGGRK